MTNGMSRQKGDKKLVTCSFCDARSDDDDRLVIITHNDAAICNDCICICIQSIAARLHSATEDSKC